ncbi:hypothetical protein P4O66_000064 [Electrophorus voltai]|uniref:Uncharacterized protein n=1 Tax=Electrophorus voltai TaxID=2609070 RepID=A0AAD8ZVJ4_9TELE|nr:hypothetical protein P4O66_000064 [Electrophorus voltai]
MREACSAQTALAGGRRRAEARESDAEMDGGEERSGERVERPVMDGSRAAEQTGWGGGGVSDLESAWACSSSPLLLTRSLAPSDTRRLINSPPPSEQERPDTARSLTLGEGGESGWMTDGGVAMRGTGGGGRRGVDTNTSANGRGTEKHDGRA